MIMEPDAISFNNRTANWLEALRKERFKPKKMSSAKEEKFMKFVLKAMSPEQMKGYLKGLKK